MSKKDNQTNKGPKMTLEEVKLKVSDWLFNAPERTTVNREWDNQFITDAALIAMTLKIAEEKLAEQALHDRIMLKEATELLKHAVCTLNDTRKLRDWKTRKDDLFKYLAGSPENPLISMVPHLQVVHDFCIFSNGVLRYVKNPGSGKYYCEVHKRPAEWLRLPLGIEEPMHVCNPNLGGITMPCRVTRGCPTCSGGYTPPE